MFEGYIAGKFANKMFEKNLYKIVKRHAFWGALVLFFPLFGLDWAVFVYVLWHMYHSICKELGTTLNFKTITTGFVVNVVVAIVLDVAFSFFPFLSSFIVYAQFYFSGKAYIESIKKLNNK
jgi:hypothetical protein